jgi:hypothetical protein
VDPDLTSRIFRYYPPSIIPAPREASRPGATVAEPSLAPDRLRPTSRHRLLYLLLLSTGGASSIVPAWFLHEIAVNFIQNGHAFILSFAGRLGIGRMRTDVVPFDAVSL